MNSIDQIMGYIMPYMPIKLSEKQDLQKLFLFVKIFCFHYILVNRKKIQLQIEVAQKVSEK